MVFVTMICCLLVVQPLWLLCSWYSCRMYYCCALYRLADPGYVTRLCYQQWWFSSASSRSSRSSSFRGSSSVSGLLSAVWACSWGLVPNLRVWGWWYLSLLTCHPGFPWLQPCWALIAIPVYVCSCLNTTLPLKGGRVFVCLCMCVCVLCILP